MTVYMFLCTLVSNACRLPHTPEQPFLWSPIQWFEGPLNRLFASSLDIPLAVSIHAKNMRLLGIKGDTTTTKQVYLFHPKAIAKFACLLAPHAFKWTLLTKGSKVQRESNSPRVCGLPSVHASQFTGHPPASTLAHRLAVIHPHQDALA